MIGWDIMSVSGLCALRDCPSLGSVKVCGEYRAMNPIELFVTGSSSRARRRRKSRASNSEICSNSTSGMVMRLSFSLRLISASDKAMTFSVGGVFVAGFGLSFATLPGGIC